jgi:metallo-beta-lactamase family protein
MGTLGRAIQDGAKKVKIMGTEVKVRANVVFIEGYSGHKDSDRLLAFVEKSRDTLEKVYTVLGEPKSAMFLAQRINDILSIKARAPVAGETVYLEC